MMWPCMHTKVKLVNENRGLRHMNGRRQRS